MVRRRGVLLRLAESMLALPLVVPPVVTGYCLLVLFSPKGVLGKWLEAVRKGELPGREVPKADKKAG